MKGISHEHTSQHSLDAEWTLSLCPLQENVYYKGMIQIDLTPLQKDGQKLGIHPVFNNDGKVETQGFILEIQKVGIDSCQTMESTAGSQGAKEQEKKALNDLKIQIAKPLTEKKICFVCRERYVDYLEHISHISHRKKIRVNPCTRMIEQFCQSFSGVTSQLFAVGKRKLQSSTSSVEGEENAQNSSKNPSKKRFIEKPPTQGKPTQTKNTLHTFNQEMMLTNNYVN